MTVKFPPCLCLLPQLVKLGIHWISGADDTYEVAKIGHLNLPNLRNWMRLRQNHGMSLEELKILCSSPPIPEMLQTLQEYFGDLAKVTWGNSFDT